MRKELELVQNAASLADTDDEFNLVVDLVEKIEDPELKTRAGEMAGRIIEFRFDNGLLESSSLELEHADRDFTDGEIACMALAKYASDVPQSTTLDQ